jgi:RNA polymerase sigma factor (sigma-70 family)
MAWPWVLGHVEALGNLAFCGCCFLFQSALVCPLDWLGCGERRMTGDDQRWQQVIQGLWTGDRQSVQDFCAEYGSALERLADKHLPAALRRRIGPEDVVQSACRTFMRRARLGEFKLADSDSLWRLLCAITLTKVREQARYHLRQRRGVDQEVALNPTPDDSSGPGFQPAAHEPTPAEAAEFADQFQHVVAQLDDEERQVVDLKLQECTNEEVALRMGCSERTVRRILKRVQTHLGRAFEVAAK